MSSLFDCALQSNGESVKPLPISYTYYVVDTYPSMAKQATIWFYREHRGEGKGSPTTCSVASEHHSQVLRSTRTENCRVLVLLATRQALLCYYILVLLSKFMAAANTTP